MKKIKHKSEDEIVYSFKDLRALTADLQKSWHDMKAQYDAQVEAYAKLKDINDTITQAKSENEDWEAKKSNYEDIIEDLEDKLGDKVDCEVPMQIKYLATDYKSLLDNPHFADELEQLIRKYKGF